MEVNLNGISKFNFKLSGTDKSTAVQQNSAVTRSEKTSINGLSGQSINDTALISDKARRQAYIDSHHKLLSLEEQDALAEQVENETAAKQTEISNAKGIISISSDDANNVKFEAELGEGNNGFFKLDSCSKS